MEINALGAQYLNSTYVPLSSSPAPRADLQSAGGGTYNAVSSTFGELLKRAQSTEGISSSVISKKTAIDKTDKLYEACAELETFLVKSLIKSMRGTVQKSKLIDTGFAGEMYEDMLYDEYAKTFSRNANFGFAEMAYRELAAYR